MNINSLNKLNSKVGMSENRINKIEDAAIELTQSEQQRENRLKKKSKQEQKQSLRDLWDCNKKPIFFPHQSIRTGEKNTK